MNVNDGTFTASQSSLKRVLVSESPTSTKRSSRSRLVAILFEASPGFGATWTAREGQEDAGVAILFEASPGFGASAELSGKSKRLKSQSSLKRVLVSESLRFSLSTPPRCWVAILFEASPGFGEARVPVLFWGPPGVGRNPL